MHILDKKFSMAKSYFIPISDEKIPVLSLLKWIKIHQEMTILELFSVSPLVLQKAVELV